MRDDASQLVDRARDAGTIREDVSASDLLALVSGIALTGLPAIRLEMLLDLIRDGYSTATARR